jgi:hypothetical protein
LLSLLGKCLGQAERLSTPLPPDNQVARPDVAGEVNCGDLVDPGSLMVNIAECPR